MHPRSLVGEVIRYTANGSTADALVVGFDAERRQPRQRKGTPAYCLEIDGRLTWVPLSEVGPEVLIVKRIAAVWSG